MKSLIMIFLFRSLSLVNASEQAIDCRAKIEITDAATKLILPDCGLAQQLAASPDVQDYHRKIIYEKLAEKLALNIGQNLEETTLLDQYFSANNKTLLSNDQANVKNNCKLDDIAQIEKCDGKISLDNPSYKFKLALLKSQLKNNIASTCAKQDLSLQEILTSKVIETLGIPSQSDEECEKPKNACPIQGVSGAMILSSQLDKKSAENIITLMTSTNSSLDNDQHSAYENFFKNYPQFKIIDKSDINFRKDFIKHLKSFNKNNTTAKEFIDNYFLSKEGNKNLSDALVSQCTALNDNVRTFLCGEDLKGDQLASLDSETSVNLFALNPNLDDQDILDDAPGDGTTFYAAYGFQCLAKSKTRKNKKLNRDNSVDSLYSKFTKSNRPQLSSEDVETSNSKFCSMYNCQDETVKTTEFCKDGGPLSSDGLYSIFDCGNQECSSDILKYISYLESFKKINIIQSNFASTNAEKSSSSITNTNSTSKPHYSIFLENYLGLNGTLKAEGRKVTATTIAQKSKEIADRKPEPTSLTSTTHDSKKTEIKASETSSTIAPTAPQENTLTQSSTPPVPFEQFAPITNSPSIPSKRLPTVATTKPTAKEPSSTFNFGNNERDSEIQKMRSELEELTKSMKGTEAEKLATISDTNSKYSPKDIGGSNKSNSDEGLNRAERERNAEYQRNLAAWESRLRTRESELFSREFRGPTSSGEVSNSKTAQNNGSGSRTSKTDSALQLTATEKDKGAQSKTGAAGNGNGSADSPETIVSSDDLANLKLESLKKLGINSNSAFIMKISHKGKFYNVSVKTFLYKGKDILVPLLNESNSTLAQIILESPLFRDYKQMQINRQKERQDFAKNL